MENIVLTEGVYYILLSLEKPLHGYGIMKNVQELSHGRVKLAAGTLYGALTSLLKKEWIIEIETDKEDRKREYQITPLGKEVLYTEIRRLKELYENGSNITKGWK